MSWMKIMSVISTIILFFYHLVIILFLTAGNDELDEDHVGDQHPLLRDLLRDRAGQHPVDDHRRALHAGHPARRHVHRRARQLALQLRRGDRLPQNAGESQPLLTNY